MALGSSSSGKFSGNHPWNPAHAICVTPQSSRWSGQRLDRLTHTQTTRRRTARGSYRFASRCRRYVPASTRTAPCTSGPQPPP